MRRRLCHDIVAVDLNAIYRLMRPEWAENEPEPLPSEACSYRAIRVGEGGSMLAEPDERLEAGPHPLAHGGAGGGMATSARLSLGRGGCEELITSRFFRTK